MRTLYARFIALLALVLCLWAGAGLAQISDQARDYYERWQATALRADEAIVNERASNAAFADLRAELVTFRERFEEAREDNSARIRVLRSQLEALGPEPDAESGETEPADLAEVRAELNDQLRELRVPVVLAQEAFGRAEGLILEIDRIVRERRAERLLERGASPLNPAIWPSALREMSRAFSNLGDETLSNWRLAVENNRLREQLPVVLLFLAIGTLLLVRGRRWASTLVSRLRRIGGRGTGVWSFVASLLRIVLPYVGLVLILSAIVLTDTLGVRGDLLFRTLPLAGAVLLAASWVGDRVYAKNEEYALIALSGPRRAASRRNLMTLAFCYAWFLLISVQEEVENLSDETRAVLGFAPILLAALAMYRLRSIAMADANEAVQDTEQEGEATGSRPDLLRLGPTLRRLMMLVAVAAPVLAALGFNAMAEGLIYPAILTLGVFGTSLALHRFFVDLFGWVTNSDNSTLQDSVAPALISFFLVLAMLPVLALVWGTEVTSLRELWSRFLRGFAIGETTISPMDFLTFAVIFGVGYTLTRMVQSALRGSLLPKTKLDVGGQNAVVSGTGYVGIFLAALVAISVAGLDLSSLAIVAGALSVGIGFGLQTIVSNFVSGIILLIERPISQGDWIEVGGQMGYVRDISVRSTRIETFDKTDVIVPNSDFISGTVTNYTRGNTIGRVIAPVGVAYGTDTKKVEKILREIAQAHPMVLAVPPPNVVFRGFGADSLDFEIRAILRDVNWVLSVHSDMNHEIARRFTEEGIEIPFAQRDVWLRNPEALHATDDPEKPPTKAQNA